LHARALRLARPGPDAAVRWPRLEGTQCYAFDHNGGCASMGWWDW
jgi:hypothetical protein